MTPGVSAVWSSGDNVKKVPRLLTVLVFLSYGALAYFSKNYLSDLLRRAESSAANNQVTFVGPRFLSQYAIPNLSQRSFEGSDFKLEKLLKENSDYSSYLFSFRSDGKKVTGLANFPKGEREFPVIIMVRGYVDREKYTTGTGTSRAGEIFVSKGYVTFAPDFLGYGGSEAPSVEPLEERFQTYTTTLDLYGLIRRLPESNPSTPLRTGPLTPGVNIDSSRVYLWAHSNGGQIALTFLEITGAAIPTVLWAPVSKPFPYSILYYTDEAEDLGKNLRAEIASFETYYDVKKYSLTEYLGQINAPILLQSGTKDSAVPLSWGEELNKKLGILNKDVTYEVYEGADHNLLGSWSQAVQRDLDFFSGH